MYNMDFKWIKEYPEWIGHTSAELFADGPSELSV
jgi:hypothetical protein